MAHTPAERAGFLQQPSTAVVGVLVALHVLVLVVIIARAGSLAPGDADVRAGQRIATSPGHPLPELPGGVHAAADAVRSERSPRATSPVLRPGSR